MNSVHRSAARRQGGSVVITATIALSLIVIVLAGTQLGYMFYMKRELQKTADLAALSGAQAVLPANCANATAAAIENAVQNMPAMFTPVTAAEIACGHWDPAARPEPHHFGTPDAGQALNAVHVAITRTAPLLPALPGSASFAISVEALAAKRQPMASLSIRSTLATVDTERSKLLNAVVGSMLGGSLNVAVGGWQGLVDSRIKLLDYLDQLKLDLGINAARYDEVLGTSVEAGVLLRSMITVMERSGATATAAVQALQSLAATAEVSPVALTLGELLNIASGTEAAGLHTDLQLFDLVQGVVQLANSKNALAADIPIEVPGILGVTAKVRAVEAPQVSAVGNPLLIDSSLGLSDPNRVHVRTAQVRVLLSLNLSGLGSAVSNVLSAVTGALSPLAKFLESVATLNLGNIVSDLVGTVVCGVIVPCTETKVVYADALSTPIDVSISSGNGSAIVTGHSCGAGESKTLSVQASTSVAELHVGKVANAFSSSTPTAAEPVGIVEVGYRVARPSFCLLSVLCTGVKWKNSAGSFVEDEANAKKNLLSGLGLVVNSAVPGSVGGQSLSYAAPALESLPEIDAAPYDGIAPDPSFKPLSAQSVVAGLAPALGGIRVEAYSSTTSGVLGALLNGTVSLVNGLLNTLQTIVKNALAPLLDPAVNLLLDLLGIDLAKAEVGARLSCHRGVELVY